MDLKHKTVLPPELRRRCREHGRAMAASYARGENPASHAVSSHGADTDPNLLAESKMAECAFCLWACIDPLAELNWDNAPDAWDVRYCGRYLDIKHTAGLTSRLLIWPYRKVFFYDQTKFDALVLVRGADPIFEVIGWTGKAEFKAKRSIAAPGDRRGLTPGTWFLDMSQLRPLYELERTAA
jgi:hypothetical protein